MIKIYGLICLLTVISHAYDEKLLDEIYKRIIDYVPTIKELLNTIDSNLKF